MIGQCQWKGQCSHCNSDSYQKQYCNDSVKARKCPYRPMNYGDKKVAQNYNYGKAAHSNANFGRILLIIVLIFVIGWFVYTKFLS